MVLSAIDDKKTANYSFNVVVAFLALLIIWSANDITTVQDIAPEELDGTPMRQATSLSTTNELSSEKKICICKRAKASYAGMCYRLTGKPAVDASAESMLDCNTHQCLPEYECVEGYDTGIKCELRRVAAGVQPIGYGKCVQMKRHADIYLPISST